MAVQLLQGREITGSARFQRDLLPVAQPALPGVVAQVAQTQQAGVAWLRHPGGQGAIDRLPRQGIEVMGLQLIARCSHNLSVGQLQP